MTGRRALLDGHEPALDGLRALSIGLVLAYHADLGWARGGFLGISVFFALSGFLVATVLLRADVDGGISPTAFWARRVRRLFPAAMATLVLVGAFAATAASEEQVDGLPGQALAAAANVANWKFIADGSSYAARFEAPSPVLHFWSLSVEEQFYLVAPLLLLGGLASRRWRGRLWAVALGAAVAASAWGAWLQQGGTGVDRLYYGTDVRAAEILIGVAAALALDRGGRSWIDAHRRPLGWAGAGAVVALGALAATTELPDPFLWQGGLAACAALTVVAIVGAIAGVGPVRVLAWGPIAALGRISYGTYLYHFPVFLWLSADRIDLDGTALLALRLAVTLGLATASYHLLEMPVRRGWTPPVPRRWVPATVPAVALVAVAVVAAGSAWSDTEPVVALGRSGEELGQAPAAAAPDEPLDVLVISDELGAEVAGALTVAVADDPSIRLVEGPTFGCDGPATSAGATVCRSWLDGWTPAVEAAQPDLVLLLVTGWPDAEAAAQLGLDGVDGPGGAAVLSDTLDAGVDLLTSHGATVLWAPPNRGLRLEPEQFGAAMQRVLTSRPDVRFLASMPTLAPGGVGYAEAAAPVLADHLGQLAREAQGRLRIMLVGDSQIASLAVGLEPWAAATSAGDVWSVALHGCALLVEGTFRLPDGTEPVPDDVCGRRDELWTSALERFRPDVVVVQAAMDDLADRRFPGTDAFAAPGDDAFDDAAAAAYLDIVDRLSVHGARIAWLTTPCVRDIAVFPGAGPQVDDDPARAAALNRVVAQVRDQRPAVVELVDLAGVLCPDGTFLDEADGIDPLRPDGVHLSEEASAWVAEVLGPRIVAVAG